MALIDLIEDFPKHLPIALVGGLSEVIRPESIVGLSRE